MFMRTYWEDGALVAMAWRMYSFREVICVSIFSLFASVPRLNFENIGR
jgi:hypothetical protein